MNKHHIPELIISAVGDISFEGKLATKPDITVFSEVNRIMSTCDLGIANLENPLTTQCKRIIGKCTLRGDPGWAAILRESGINVVSLANNHLMDYGPEGLFDTIEALVSAGIKYVGAGINIEDACAPIFVKIKRLNVAFLARSSVTVTSHVNAGPSTPGVAFLDTNQLKVCISQCRRDADLVIVLLHWGMEEYTYPTPAQIDLARQLILTGADVILGHHPHVLQGMHRIENGQVAYSLGNFMFDDFSWNTGGEGKDIMLTLSELNRKGMILNMSWDKIGPANVSKVFTRISSGRIIIDDDPLRDKEFKRLSLLLNRPLYPLWWRSYAVRREWDLRIKTAIHPARILRNIWKIRPRHITELVTILKKSLNIARGKSTNPYD